METKKRYLLIIPLSLVLAVSVAFSSFRSIPVYASDFDDELINDVQYYLRAANSLLMDKFAGGNIAALGFALEANYLSWAIDNNYQYTLPIDTLSPYALSDTYVDYGFYYNSDNLLRACAFGNFPSDFTCDACTFAVAPDFMVRLRNNSPNGYFTFSSNTLSRLVNCYGDSGGTVSISMPYNSDYYGSSNSSYFSNSPWSAYFNFYIGYWYRIDFPYIEQARPTLLPSFTPFQSDSYWAFAICGTGGREKLPDLGSSMTPADLLSPAAFQDYINTVFNPAVSTTFNITLPSLDLTPVDPTEDSSGCCCEPFTLPPEWLATDAELDTEHYTIPYSDLVQDPWEDLQAYVATEVDAVAADSGGITQTVSRGALPANSDVIDTIDDFQAFAVALLDRSGLLAVFASLIAVGFIIRFISLH